MRFIGPALVPALLFLFVIYFSDRRREPLPLVLLVFVLGGAAKAITMAFEGRAAAWTGLESDGPATGGTGSVLFLFGFAAPMREAAKVAAMWPAFPDGHSTAKRDRLPVATL